jgi:hypothetical protein
MASDRLSVVTVSGDVSIDSAPRLRTVLKAAVDNAIAQKIIDAQPRLVDVVGAKTVIPELSEQLILHAGPPIAFKDMPEPVQGSAIGAVLFEGWAKDEAAARELCEKVQFAPNQHFRTVAPMGGILTGNMPVFVVENATDGNRAYTTIHEGEGTLCATAYTTSPSTTIWSGCGTFSARHSRAR